MFARQLKADEEELVELDAIVRLHPNPKSLHTSNVVVDAKARAAELRQKKREHLPAYRQLQRAEQAVHKAAAAHEKAKAAVDELRK